MPVVQILAVLVSLVIFFVIVDFIRRGLLKEKYSVLWLAAAAITFTLSIWKSLLDKVASIMGVGYPPSLLFLVAFLFIMLILLHYSVVISIMHEKNKHLAQEVTLLKELAREAGMDFGGRENTGSPDSGADGGGSRTSGGGGGGLQVDDPSVGSSGEGSQERG